MGGPAAAALAAAAARLGPVSGSARLDAELLLAHALGTDRSALLLALPGVSVPPEFAGLVARRAAGEPLAYITGWRDFWDMRLAVTPDVLVPRPDSETLIEAIAALGLPGDARIVDLGTGSGALLLAALRVLPGASGIGIDRSAAAIGIARANAARHGLSDRAGFRVIDWTDADWIDRVGRPSGGPFDLLLANPPYVETGAALAADVVGHEPHGALFAGADGLDDYRCILPALPALIGRGGQALVEIGAGQAAAVGALADAAGLAVAVRRDLAGRDRALYLTMA